MSLLRSFRQLRGPEFLALLILLLLFALLGKGPRPLEELPSNSPAMNPEEALAKFHVLQQRDDVDPTNPACRSRLFYHGKKTDTVFVLLHGLSNCPKQFFPLAEILAKSGANVIVPRLPEHGLEDRTTNRLRYLTATELVRSGNEAVDIANGLGEEVVVVGLSISGATAAWLAQNRAEVARAMLVAPFLGVPKVPGFLDRPLRNLFLLLPNMQIWWDWDQRENLEGPSYAYPQFSTRAVAEVLNLGALVVQEAAENAPKAQDIILVTSATDAATNTAAERTLVKRWTMDGYQDVEELRFPAEKNILHDMIDPNQPGAQTEVVYPILLEWLLRKS